MVAMQMDWDNLPDPETFEPLPEGDYLCEVTKVDDTKTTQSGDPLWNLEFTVVDGEYEGRKFFDNISFGEKAIKRVKLVCSRLGLKTEGKSELRPDDLIGKQVWATLDINEFTDRDGNKKRNNKVPFAGYQRITDGAPRKQAAARPARAPAEDEVPF